MKNAQLRGRRKASFPRLFFLGFRTLALGVAFLLFSERALAESGKAAEWLDRAEAAAHRLNYEGTMSYSVLQGTQRFERLKFVHYAQENKEYLRTETLNGAFRETIRVKDVVRAYFPELKIVRVMPSALSRVSPGVMQHNIQNDIKAILKNYTFAEMGIERVAGRAAQAVVFTPKDNYRYEQRFWFDQETGLFLARRIVDLSTQREIENATFVDIKVNIPPPEPLVIAWPDLPTDWKVEQTGSNKKKNVASGWRASALPPGFTKIAEETRRFTGKPEATTVLVYSDGLMTVSVFVERTQGNATTARAREVSLGFLAAYTRQEGDYLITAVGKVPNDTLRLIAQGLVHR